MADKSKISWTDASWNPVTGCSRVSPGCEHCYAESLSLRMGWSKKPWKAQNAAENVILHPERLEAPLHWRAPRRIFVNSMSDVFHEQIPTSWIDCMFDVMEATPRHTFQILTKRPERMREYCVLRAQGRMDAAGDPVLGDESLAELSFFMAPNVWLGVSVEDQRRANERVPLLLDTPAAVRFLSCEPLLAPVELQISWFYEPCPGGCGCIWPMDADVHDCGCDGGCCDDWWLVRRPKIQWVIDGGESGVDFRPDDQDWYRDLRDQCLGSRVSYFHKQSAGRRPATGVELDGVVWHQFPGG